MMPSVMRLDKFTVDAMNEDVASVRRKNADITLRVIWTQMVEQFAMGDDTYTHNVPVDADDQYIIDKLTQGGFTVTRLRRWYHCRVRVIVQRPQHDQTT